MSLFKANVHVKVGEETKNRLERMAKCQRVTMSELIRELVEVEWARNFAGRRLDMPTEQDPREAMEIDGSRS